MCNKCRPFKWKDSAGNTSNALQVILLQKPSVAMCIVYKNDSSNVTLPRGRICMSGNATESTNDAVSISIKPLNKAIFGLGGLGFCQKVISPYTERGIRQDRVRRIYF